MSRLSEKYREKVYTEKLENGLHVVIINKEGYVRSHALFMTPFGAMKSKMYSEDKEIVTFKDGLAHFLEHKMFESKEGDIMDRFSAMGISANAFTSYNETVYYFSTSFDIQEPLELLLDFVQELDCDEASVEKEKGIIVQELRMYAQMSDAKFVQEMFSSLYKAHPLSIDIGGSEESVNSTTVEDLYQCYELNYHPQNMTLIVVSGEDPNKIMEIVKNNQSKKQFKDLPKLEIYSYNEPKEVNREKYSFQMDITQPRFGLAFKLCGINDDRERYTLDLALKILMESYFSTSNVYVQKWLDERLINDSFVYDSEIGRDYGYIMLVSETEKMDALKEEFLRVCHEMVEKGIDDSLLSSIKKRLYGMQIKLMNRFEDYAIAYGRFYYNGIDFFESLDILSNITKEDVKRSIEHITLEHMAEVHLLPLNSDE
ncbi:MAG: insulinase family protein [Erysipelotrichaceae bacterium]|nr:insulinase family protein [Erysipelotrichaceae bacterium]MBR3693214.1 insulinase family protein [Erysipelotrichales bacterium]